MTPLPVASFKSIFNRLGKDTLFLVDELYDRDVEFIDPVHSIKGASALKVYFASLYDGVASCHFDWLAEVVGDGEAMVTWEMRLVHKRLRAREPVVIPGASHIRFTEKVTFHHDYFDLGKLIYERIPILGAAVRTIKKKL